MVISVKKLIRGCVIVILLCLALGAAFVTAAETEEGRAVISRVVEKVTGGRVTGDRVWAELGGVLKWSDQVRDRVRGQVAAKLPDPGYEIEDVSSFDPGHDILEGDVQKFCLDGAVESLDVRAGGCAFELQSSGDDSFYIEAWDVGKFQAYVESGTLRVRTVTGLKRWEELGSAKVRLYAPDGFRYREAGLELGAGGMELAGLQADALSLEAGAGRITADGLRARTLRVKIDAGRIEMNDMSAGTLEASAGMGEIKAQGSLESGAQISCAMGNIELTLAGNREDFNYSLEGALGNIHLEEEGYSGLEMSKEIDNGASKEIMLKCTAGNIAVTFAEAAQPGGEEVK